MRAWVSLTIRGHAETIPGRRVLSDPYLASVRPLIANQRHARESDRPVTETVTLYAMEAFLNRLAQTPHREDSVLKGGVLLAAFRFRRPTSDIGMEALTEQCLESFDEQLAEVIQFVDPIFSGAVRADAAWDRAIKRWHES